MKKLSIIIAAYNIEDYIENCLSSLVNQTQKNFEVIVVNDGSTDNTCSLINNYQNRLQNMVQINTKNSGLIEARKTGLRYATGEFLYFLDGDDWVEKDFVEVITKELESGNEYDVIMFHSQKCYENKIIKPFELYKSNTKLTFENILDSTMLPAIWGKVIRKKFLDKNKITFLSNVTYGEDLAITFAIFLCNPRVKTLDKILHNYLIREGSITNRVSPKNLELLIVFEYIKVLLEEKYGNQYQKQLEQFYIDKMIGYAYIVSLSNKEIRRKILEEYKNKKVRYNIKKFRRKNNILAYILENSGDFFENIIAECLICLKKAKKRLI